MPIDVDCTNLLPAPITAQSDTGDKKMIEELKQIIAETQPVRYLDVINICIDNNLSVIQAKKTLASLAEMGIVLKDKDDILRLRINT